MKKLYKVTLMTLIAATSSLASAEGSLDKYLGWHDGECKVDGNLIPHSLLVFNCDGGNPSVVFNDYFLGDPKGPDLKPGTEYFAQKCETRYAISQVGPEEWSFESSRDHQAASTPSLCRGTLKVEGDKIVFKTVCTGPGHLPQTDTSDVISTSYDCRYSL